MTPNPIKRRDLYTLLLVLLLAVVPRMGDLASVTHFSYDQATLSRLALDMAAGKSFALTGIESSAGIPNSPATVYFLVIPYFFTDNPQMVTLFIAAWNVFGVGLLWWLARRYFNPTIALIAGAAYALHPHAIHYSRSIWAQDYHTPFILLGFLFALLGFVERRRWAQIAALPLFIFGLQIHYAAWTLIPAYAWLVWLGRKNIRPAALTVSILITVVTLIPFALGVAGAAETASSAGAVVERLDDLALRDKALLYMVRLATGLVAPWTGQELIGVYDSILTIASPVTALWLLVGAAVALGLLVVWRWWGWQWGMWLVLWALLPFAVFVPNWTGVYPHYFIPNLPANALLTGIGVAWLLERIPQRRLRSLALACFAAILLSQGVVYLDFLRHSAVTYTELQRTPTPYLLAIREQLRPYDNILISGGTSSESGYDIWSTLLYRSADCVREVVIAAGGVAVFPEGEFAVVTPNGALEPAFGNLYDSQNPLRLPLRAGEGDYRIDVWESAPDWNSTPLQAISPITFDNGVTWTGYALDESRIYLEWRLEQRGERDYQYFAHFLDASGERIAQQDASFYPSLYWCAGDRLVTWIDLAGEIPDTAAVLRVGMYRNENGGFVNANVLDANGAAAGLWGVVSLAE